MRTLKRLLMLALTSTASLAMAHDISTISRIDCVRRDNSNITYMITPGVYSFNGKTYAALSGTVTSKVVREDGSTDWVKTYKDDFFYPMTITDDGQTTTIDLINYQARFQDDQRWTLKTQDFVYGTIEKEWFIPGLPGYNPDIPGRSGTHIYDCKLIQK